MAHQVLVNMPLEKRERSSPTFGAGLARMSTPSRRWRMKKGLGRVEDKIKKNLLVIHKTPGVEILQPTAWTGDSGLTLMERAPFGVIGSITPCTNPTETILCNGIGMVAGGNAVVFNTHPSAKTPRRM